MVFFVETSVMLIARCLMPRPEFDAGFTRRIPAPRPSGSLSAVRIGSCRFVRPRTASYFSCAAKKSNQKKAAPMLLLSCASLGTSLCLALRAAAAVQIGNPADLSRSARVRQTGHPWPGCRMARVHARHPAGCSSLRCDARRGKGGNHVSLTSALPNFIQGASA